MRKVKETLKLHSECGVFIRQIAISCSLSRSAVSDTIAGATAAGMSWPVLVEIGDSELESLPYPQALGRKAKPDSVKLGMPHNWPSGCMGP